MTEIDKVMQDRFADLQAFCTSISDGIKSGGLVWAFNEPSTGEKAANYDVQAICKLFDRTKIEENYVKARDSVQSGEEKGAIRQDLALAIAQSDILSGFERDLIARKKGRIRRLAHEAISRYSAGSDKGVFQTVILYYLQSQIDRVSDAVGGNSDIGSGSNDEITVG